MQGKRVIFLFAFFVLLTGLVLPAQAIFERDLPLLTVTGEKTKGVIEVENDHDSRYRTRDVKLTITARDLEPHGLYSVWLVEKTDGGGQRKGFGVSPYTFTTDGSGTGRFINTIPEYDFARWDLLEIRHHPGGDANDLSTSVVVRKGEIWRAHPY